MIRITLLLSVLALLSAAPAFADTAGDVAQAKAQITAFDDTLLSTMKEAKTLGFQGRYDRMAPAVDKTFDLGFMARFMVGAKWNDLPAGQQAGLVKSFRDFTIGQYANRFNDYDGETLTIAGEPTMLRSDIRVATQLKPKNDKPVELDYMLRHSSEGDHGLKVIDIFLQGTISQLATQRSQFQSVLQNQGVEGLIAMLDKKATDASIPGAAGNGQADGKQ